MWNKCRRKVLHLKFVRCSVTLTLTLCLLFGYMCLEHPDLVDRFVNEINVSPLFDATPTLAGNLRKKTEFIERVWSNVSGEHLPDILYTEHPEYVPDLQQAVIADLVPKPSENAVKYCPDLLNENNTKLHKDLYKLEKNETFVLKPNSYYNLTKHCESFITSRKYIMTPVNEEEAEFPIAFTIMMYTDVEQVERLLRAIYRPQNYYCIHVDAKAHTDIYHAISNISSCFKNVFMSSRRVPVFWGNYGVLESDIICMQDLYKYSKMWKYLINLTGQEFPLKTNYDLVRILKTYNGAIDVGGIMNDVFNNRTAKKDRIPPPAGITIAKGPVHIVVTYEFVKFMFENKTAKDFLVWVKDTVIPDETYFNSLAHSPQLKVPGAHTDDFGFNNNIHPSFARFKKWFHTFKCGGVMERGICLMNAKDLWQVVRRPELFLNKIILSKNHIAYECLEYLHYWRTKEEILGQLTFNTTFYENIEYVHKHI